MTLDLHQCSRTGKSSWRAAWNGSKRTRSPTRMRWSLTRGRGHGSWGWHLTATTSWWPRTYNLILARILGSQPQPLEEADLELATKTLQQLLFRAAGARQSHTYSSLEMEQAIRDREEWILSGSIEAPDVLAVANKWRHWKPGKIKTQLPTSQRALEQHLRARWLERLLGYFIPFRHQIPYMHQVMGARELEEFGHLFGDARFRTIRAHCLAYEGMRKIGLQNLPWTAGDVRHLMNQAVTLEVTPAKLQKWWGTLKWLSIRLGMLNVDDPGDAGGHPGQATAQSGGSDSSRGCTRCSATPLMCVLSFPQFGQFDITREDLESWYEWFYGEDIGGRFPPPEDHVLAIAERNAWRKIHEKMHEGNTLKAAMLSVRQDTLFWTREVYEKIKTFSRGRPSTRTSMDYAPPQKGKNKSKGKGKSKGKPGNKGKGKTPHLNNQASRGGNKQAATDPKGNQFCNNWMRGRTHKCNLILAMGRICLGDHLPQDCPGD